MDLSVDRLTVRFGARPVLDDVSASFSTGRVAVVLGANGAGKSTLLKSLAGLMAVDGGSVRLGDTDLLRIRGRDRGRAIGYLPQDAVVHWNIPVRDLVALGRLPHGGGGEEAVASALRATDTAALADRTVRTLSGGERARVLMARVLAGEPRWILADEPLASLDPLHQLETLDLLKGAAVQGIGVVAVVHDLNHAARIADDIVLLKDGRILAAGSREEVLTAPLLAEAYGVQVAILDHDGQDVIVPTGRLNT